MKNNMIFLCAVLFLTIQFQCARGETNYQQPDRSFPTKPELNISDPFAEEIPSDKYASELFRSNEWGGGEDAPGVLDPPTGGSAPISDGILITLFFTMFFLFIKRKRLNENLHSKNK